jgi:hypothetical protein
VYLSADTGYNHSFPQFVIPSGAGSAFGSVGEVFRDITTGGDEWPRLRQALSCVGVGTRVPLLLHAVAAWCTGVIGSQSRVDPERCTLGGAIVAAAR